MLKQLSMLSLIVLGAPAIAAAQCDFDGPARARGLKSDMVRAFMPCGAGITSPAPNTATTSGTPACAPPTPYSDFEFGPKGSCRVSVSTKLLRPCPEPAYDDCQELVLKADCKDIVQAGGTALIDAEDGGVGWALRTLTRSTTADPSIGDITVIDSPAQFQFPPARRGRLKIKLALGPCLGNQDCGFFGPIYNAAGCTNIEIVRAALLDPTGQPFATPGSSTR